MEIKANLFSLDQKGISDSEMMYNGKIIKCLVAPYHSYDALEKVIPYTKTTFLFPEREVTSDKLRSLVNIAVQSPGNDEIRIITTNLSVICDMVDSCVRVLTEDGRVLPSPCKTFAANIHTIKYELLENDAHRISKESKAKSNAAINDMFDKIKEYEMKGSIPKNVHDEFSSRVDMIGEPIVRNAVRNTLDRIPVSNKVSWKNSSLQTSNR